jgi:cytochrome b6-f complex iron-sulfur subunit
MSRQEITRERFIRYGAALTLAPAGAVALASCGGGSSSGETGSSEAPQETTRTAAPEETASRTEPAAEETTAQGSSSGAEGVIAAESEVSPGSAVEFEDGGEPAVLVRLESGDFVAYSAVCTHQGCAVAYDSGQLSCPCHGSVFDPANGAAVVNGPATAPLAEIPVSVEGGSVTRA